MKKIIFFVLCLILLINNAAKAEIGVYKRNDLEIKIDTKIYSKNTTKNFDDVKSLYNTESYDYWYNYIDFGVTAKGMGWKARLKLFSEDIPNDDSSVTEDDGNDEVEIEEAFLDYRFLNLPFFFKAGLWEQSFGTEMFYGDESNTGLMFGYEISDNFMFSIGCLTNKESKRNHNISFIKTDAELDKENNLSAFLVYVREDIGYDANHPKRTHDVRLYNFGINFKDKIDNFELELEGNKQFGSCRDYVNEKKRIKKINYKGYALMAKGGMKIGSINPAITLGYGSGDRTHRTKDDAFVGYKSDYEPDNIVIDNGLASGSRDTISNLMFMRLDVRIKVGDKLSIIPGIGYYRHVKEIDVKDKNRIVVGSSDRIGTEIDLSIIYRINKYICFKFVQGYLFASEGIGIKDPDNAWKAETKLTFKL